MILAKRRSEKVEALGKIPLFSGFSRRYLNLIARHVDEVRVEKGRLLARQGGLAREGFLVVDGQARADRDGKLIARLGPGDFFGEMSLIDGKPRSATVSAETPMVLLVIEARSFSALLGDAPPLQRKILVTLCERLRDADAVLATRN